MPKVDVYDIEGKKVSSLELKEEIFGIEPNEAVVHSVLVNYLANQRQGTQSTKTRSEVSGGGKNHGNKKVLVEQDKEAFVHHIGLVEELR